MIVEVDAKEEGREPRYPTQVRTQEPDPTSLARPLRPQALCDLESGLVDIEAGFFVCFAYGAIYVFLVFIDLAARK